MFPYFLAICKKYILRQNLQGNQSLFVQFVFHIVLSFQVKYDYYVPITNYNLTQYYGNYVELYIQKVLERFKVFSKNISNNNVLFILLLL